MAVSRAAAQQIFTSALGSVRSAAATAAAGGPPADPDEIARRLFQRRNRTNESTEPGERPTLKDYQTIVRRAQRSHDAARELRQDAGARPTRAGTPVNRGIPAGVDRYEYRVIVSSGTGLPGRGPETVVIFRTTGRLTASEAVSRALSSVRSSETAIEQSEGASRLAGNAGNRGELISVSRYESSS